MQEINVMDPSVQSTSQEEYSEHQTSSLGSFSEDVAVIALFGATGAGKSTFANLASGQDDLVVGHGIESCTQEVGQTRVFTVEERPVVLIDCPGFDDSHASDSEILKRIAGFLAVTWSNKIMLAGVLYVHRITDNRFGGASRRNYRMFRKMCGADSLKNVIVVTNMWSQPPTELQLSREAQLRDGEDAFKPILAEGAQFVRHAEPTRESALAIIQYLLKQKPVVLDLSRQLVDDKQKLEDTSAGMVLAAELTEALRKHAKEIEQLKRDQAEAAAENDKKWQQEIADSREKATASSLALGQQIKSLKEGHDAQQAEWQKRFTETQGEYASTLAEMQKQHAEQFRKAQEQLDATKKKMQDENERQQAQVQAQLMLEQRTRLEQAEAEARLLREEGRRKETERAEQQRAHERMLEQGKAMAEAQASQAEALRKQTEAINAQQALENQKQLQMVTANIEAMKHNDERQRQAELSRIAEENRRKEDETNRRHTELLQQMAIQHSQEAYQLRQALDKQKTFLGWLTS